MPITWTGPLSFALYSLHHKARNFFLACATVDSVATRCSARLGLCKSLSSHTPCPEVLWIFFHYPPRIICIEYKQSTPLAKGKEHLQKQHDLAGSRAYQFGKLLCFIDVGPRQKQDFVTLEALDCATLWTVEVLRCMDLSGIYAVSIHKSSAPQPQVIIPIVWRGRHDKLDVLKAQSLEIREYPPVTRYLDQTFLFKFLQSCFCWL